MKDILKLVLSLGLVCGIGSALLVWVCGITQKPIKLAEERALRDSLKIVLPETVETTDLAQKNAETVFYRALDKDGKLLAYAAQGTGHGGFGGDVKVVAGLDLQGRILGIMVTENSETPGIGSKATERKVKKSLWSVLAGKVQDDKFPPNEFLDSFTGRQACQFKKVSEPKKPTHIKGVAGATYSSTAVINAVNAICKDFESLEKGKEE